MAGSSEAIYRISEIRTKTRGDMSAIRRKTKKKLGKALGDSEIYDLTIVKESIDARDKKNIVWVYTVDFKTDSERALSLPRGGEKKYELPESGSRKMRGRPVVCGFGPAGIFSALILAEAGYRPIVLERGKAIDEREKDVLRFWNEGTLNAESNVQFGEGGAGTFSDGKLVTGIHDPRVRLILHEFNKAGANGDILYTKKPHVGTDRLKVIVPNLREKIKEYGGEILFETRLDGIEEENGEIRAVIVSKTGEKSRIETDALVLAIGHSARDTVRMLYENGVKMEQKPFSIGIRIEHPQELIDIAQYGAPHEALKLPPAEYKLSHKNENGRGVYTFCMCPGGEVIAAASELGVSVTNGMSYSARDGKHANSALLSDVRTSDFESTHPLAGIDFQEKYERLAFKNGKGHLNMPRSTWSEFERCEGEGACVQNSLPAFAKDAIIEAMPYFAKKLKGFDSPDAIVTAVESRSSSPVRIVRGESFESSIKGIYPAGEGAGYAGGIVSAAVDGVRVSEAIIKKFEKISDCKEK